MNEMPSYDELARRITKHISVANDHKEMVSSCWHGYLAALLEWGLISPEQHGHLIKLLTPIEPNPATQIFLGD